MVFSREFFVRELSSYYEFLADLYLPRSAIKYPPPGGWPHLTLEVLSSLKKNATVKDLIRHLPCLEIREDREQYEIYCESRAVDYSGEDILRALVRGGESVEHHIGPWSDSTILPSHVMTLSTGPAAGFYIFIDTDRDMVVLYNMLTIEPTDLSYTGYRADNEDWDQHATYTVAEFFPMLKQMWRTTELGFLNDYEVRLTGDEPDNIYLTALREHGAFTAAYDKDACLAQLEAAYAAVYEEMEYRRQLERRRLGLPTTLEAKHDSLVESVSRMDVGRSES